MAVAGIGCSSAKADGQANIAQLKLVVSALEKYQQTNGRHPPTLRQLMPGYLASIPTLRGDATWRYQVENSGKDFSLAFVGNDATWTGGYSSSDKVWYTDDK